MSSSNYPVDLSLPEVDTVENHGSERAKQVGCLIPNELAVTHSMWRL